MSFLISVLIFALISSNLNQITEAQQRLDNISRIQESLENMSITLDEVEDHLSAMSKSFVELKQIQIVTVFLFVIVFLMGLAFVIFGLYIGQEHKLPVFTKRLYLIAYFALVIPVTVIILRYIIDTLLFRGLNDPILSVAFLLLIPVTTSYILMIVKYRREIVRTT
jgi:hypothetical protein